MCDLCKSETELFLLDPSLKNCFKNYSNPYCRPLLHQRQQWTFFFVLMGLYTIFEQDEDEKVKKELKKKKIFKKCKTKKNQKKKNLKNRKKRSHQKRNSKKSSAANKEKKIKNGEAVNISRRILTLNCSMLLKYKEIEARGREAKEDVKWRVKGCFMENMEAVMDELFKDNSIETGQKMKKWISKGFYESLFFVKNISF